MGNTTVVDQLIVALRLDPRDFDRGAKQLAVELLKTKAGVRSGFDDMSKSAEKAAVSFGNTGGVVAKIFGRGGAVGLAIAIAIATGKKLNDELYEVAQNVRKLGIDSRNFDTTSARMRNMQNVAELAGGSVSDATSSIGGLAKALYDLRFNGQVSEQLQTLARLGVEFTDASGRARDFKDVTLDAASALAKLQANGTMSGSDAFFAAQQAGLQGGLANLVVQGRGATEAAFAKQEVRRQVSPEDIRAGTDRVNAYLSLGQAGEAVGVGAMTATSPAATALSRRTESIVSQGPEATRTYTKAIDALSMALGDFADATKEATGSLRRAFGAEGNWFRGKYMYGATFDSAAEKYGVRADVLRGIARTESSYDPKAINSRSGARGLMGLNPKFFPQAGKNPYNDIDTAAEHFAQLLSRTHGSEQERYIEALRMYNAGETNYRNGTNLGPENRAYAGKALSGTGLALPTPNAQSGSASSRTEITFEEVNINAGNTTDGARMGRQFNDTVERKLNASQADRGMR